MTQPDLYSGAWYRKQFAGQQFAINKACAEYASAADLLESLTVRVTSLEAALEDARSETGRLREEFQVSMEKVRDAYRKLSQGSAE